MAACQSLPVDSLERITAEIVDCVACPRLVAWRERVALERRASFRDEPWLLHDARRPRGGRRPVLHGCPDQSLRCTDRGSRGWARPSGSAVAARDWRAARLGVLARREERPPDRLAAAGPAVEVERRGRPGRQQHARRGPRPRPAQECSPQTSHLTRDLRTRTGFPNGRVIANPAPRVNRDSAAAIVNWATSHASAGRPGGMGPRKFAGRDGGRPK